MRKSTKSNDDVVHEKMPGRRLSNILLNEELLPELEKGALDLGFAHPTKPLASIAPRIIHAWQAIEVKFSAEVIAARVQEVSAAISRNYLNSNRQLVVIGVLKGCSPFISDLVRAMDQRLLMEVDFVETSFYGNQFMPAQRAEIRLPQTDLEGKDVLLVDDILDTGTTLNRIIAQLYKCKPRSIDACVLIEKTARRCEPVPELRYGGFTLKNGWVIGYGMDYEQYYRNLPYVGVLKNS